MTQTLIDYRCTLCGWTGTDDEAVDDNHCPTCGHGLTTYTVELKDD